MALARGQPGQSGHSPGRGTASLPSAAQVTAGDAELRARRSEPLPAATSLPGPGRRCLQAPRGSRSLNENKPALCLGDTALCKVFPPGHMLWTQVTALCPELGTGRGSGQPSGGHPLGARGNPVGRVMLTSLDCGPHLLCLLTVGPRASSLTPEPRFPHL